MEECYTCGNMQSPRLEADGLLFCDWRCWRAWRRQDDELGPWVDTMGFYSDGFQAELEAAAEGLSSRLALL